MNKDIDIKRERKKKAKTRMGKRNRKKMICLIGLNYSAYHDII